MGIEIRRNASGTITKHWFGAYTDANGKRVCKPLKTLIADRDNIPASLLDTGSAAFEVSKRAALDELEELKQEARRKGRDEGLVRHLIQAKTGRDFEDLPIDRLSALMARMKGRNACRSELWQGWRLSIVVSFTKWAKERGVQSVLSMTSDLAEAYMIERAKPNGSGKALTDSTLRRIKAVLGAVFDRALPDGVRNPWKAVFVHSRDGSEEIHRKALSADEIGRLLDAAESDPLIHPLLVTALSTGLRRGDVCRLSWRDVDFKSGLISVKTGKTGAVSNIPILGGLMPFLIGWLSEREKGEVFLFPDAERMLRENPDGLTWRVKKIFAQAFGVPQEAPQAAQDAPERVPLGKVLPEVLEAVQSAKMTAEKRAKMIDLLRAYAGGKSYREIQAGRSISRGGISGLLHEAEALAGVRFLPDLSAKRPSVKRAIQSITKQEREIGTRSASVYDWHCLRTSFVTNCLFGPNPMTVDQVKAITGHKTVEMILRNYAKPGADLTRAALEGALPERLARGRGEPKQITQGAADVAALAKQFKALSKTERMELTKLLKGAKK